MRLRSSSRGRNTNTAVTVTVTSTVSSVESISIPRVDGYALPGGADVQA